MVAGCEPRLVVFSATLNSDFITCVSKRVSSQESRLRPNAYTLNRISPLLYSTPRRLPSFTTVLLAFANLLHRAGRNPAFTIKQLLAYDNVGNRRKLSALPQGRRNAYSRTVSQEVFLEQLLDGAVFPAVIISAIRPPSDLMPHRRY